VFGRSGGETFFAQLGKMFGLATNETQGYTGFSTRINLYPKGNVGYSESEVLLHESIHVLRKRSSFFRRFYDPEGNEAFRQSEIARGRLEPETAYDYQHWLSNRITITW
jgi:hypothetical protein